MSAKKNKKLKLIGEDYWKLQQSKELGSPPPQISLGS